MYNKNIYLLYIVSYNEKYTFMYKRNTFSCITIHLLSLYTLLYNNKYFNYTSSCIMRNTLSHIREINVFSIHRLI